MKLLSTGGVSQVIVCLMIGGPSLDRWIFSTTQAFIPSGSTQFHKQRWCNSDASESPHRLHVSQCQLICDSRSAPSLIFATTLSMAKPPDDDSVIDAIVEEELADLVEKAVAENEVPGALSLSNSPSSAEENKRKRKRDLLRDAIRRLATLSLEDYKWRSNLFKSNEAERQVEESLARMTGEDPLYVRPMDAGAGNMGPLGKAEKKAVDWLSKVIEEEGKRAQRMVNSDGDLVRPKDLIDGGPLADMEKQAVEFVQQILNSENERWSTGTLRPKDLDESKRGPLGDAEARIVAALEDIKNSEMMRMQQSRMRGGEVVRPIDVPGILGEFEKRVLEVVNAEKQRAKDREMNEGKVVRPKDATIAGPLGEAEKQALEAVDRLKQEETKRLQNIKQVLQENRPMSTGRDSPLGMTEAATVGILRGPRLLMKVIDRVKELMQSEKLEDEDAEMLQQELKVLPGDPKSSQEKKDESSDESGEKLP